MKLRVLPALITRLEPTALRVIVPFFMPMFTIGAINRARKAPQACFNPPFWLKRRPRPPSTVSRPRLAVLLAPFQGAHNGHSTHSRVRSPKPAPIGAIKQNGLR